MSGTDLALLILVPGTVMLAEVINVLALIGWIRRLIDRAGWLESRPVPALDPFELICTFPIEEIGVGL
jgi:hypothetical protein